MMNRAHVLLRDDRKDLRVKENGCLSWQIKYKQREGKAKIRNISASGMLMETKDVFDPKEECIISFDSRLGDDDCIPRLGRLVWHQKKKFSQNRYFCGIKFLEADNRVLARMRHRVHEGVSRFLKKRFITTTVGFLLCLGLAGLIGYVLWLSGVIYQDVTKVNRRMLEVSSHQAVLIQDYVQLYRSAELKLSQDTEKLNIANQLIEEEKAALILFSKELEATGALLNHTEMLLTQSDDRNVALNVEIQKLQAQVQAKEKNATATDVEISMAEYRLKLQSIKDEMKRLKKKERVARAVAVTQVDNQKQLPDNNGYFVQGGQAAREDKKQQRLNTDGSPDSVASQGNQEVEIDITFFDSL